VVVGIFCPPPASPSFIGCQQLHGGFNSKAKARSRQAGAGLRYKTYKYFYTLTFFDCPQALILQGFPKTGKDKNPVVRDKNPGLSGQKSGSFGTKIRGFPLL
jgi:hypothetical protein